MVNEVKKLMFINFYNYTLDLTEQDRENAFTAFDMTYALSILLNEDKEDLMNQYVKFIDSIIGKQNGNTHN